MERRNKRFSDAGPGLSASIFFEILVIVIELDLPFQVFNSAVQNISSRALSSGATLAALTALTPYVLTSK